MNNLESVATWKGLPEEPVVIILDKLLESIDYVRFAAVCKEWYRLAKDKYTWDTDRWYHRPRPPMLLLPPTAPYLGPRLFSFSQQRTYNNFRLQVPSPRVGNIFCCGCGHGWLAKVDVYDDGHRRSELVWRIELVNPFRQATTTLTLPPFVFERDLFSLAKIPKAPKVLLSSDPALNPDNLWVLAFLTDGDELVFHKIGHNILKNIKATRGSSWFTDAIFYKGRFYVIDNTDGTILVFDVEKVQWRALKIAGFRSTYAYRAYLVESTKGDLLCVKRYVKKIGQYSHIG